MKAIPELSRECYFDASEEEGEVCADCQEEEKQPVKQSLY